MADKRLIDANALLKEIEDWHDSLGGTMNPADWGIQNVLQSVMDSIIEAEDIDAVEVVRCRKCKHFVKYDDDYRDEYGSDGYCDKIAYIMDGYYRGAENRNADDFCSHGERMDATDNNVGRKDGGASDGSD